MRIKAGFAALMTACALTAGRGTVDVFANVPPEAEIAAEAPPAEPEATESAPEILVPAGDTTDRWRMRACRTLLRRETRSHLTGI